MRNLPLLLLLALALGAGCSHLAVPEKPPCILLEAEAFRDTGGWVVDPQFMDQMGSPFLLAHGLGEPVRDAVTAATFPAPGTYRVWVRTRDWVAPWKAPGAPGKFQLLINGKPLEAFFGSEGAAWHWQDGGTVEIPQAGATVALHDLTGFEGRCDAVLFSRDPAFVPPNDGQKMARFRRQCLGLPEQPEDGGSFDLVVVGGGIAGSCAAVAAARLGLTVALVQDRPVLGGNGSSEVHVWPEGNTRQKPYAHIGDLVDELVPPKTRLDVTPRADEHKLVLVRAEPNITLFLEQRVNGVTTKNGCIRSVTAQNSRTAKRVRLTGRWFADCTGDGGIGFLAGADYQASPEGHMGPSNLWNVADTGKPAPFPRCPWAVDLAGKPFPGRGNAVGQWGGKGLGSLGKWFWESGFDRDPVTEVERMRDLNLRAMYGAWDTLKNTDGLYPNHRIAWAAYIAGKRESRRLLGDVILEADDFRKARVFDDGCFPCSWHIDLHTPDKAFQKGNEGEEFISRATEGKAYSYKAPYWAPYRCLYSRNIGNLFMAGRDISVTHEALGPVRVMRTGGMMGEVVGMAAFLCKKHGTTPRGVYQKHLDDFKTLMRQGVGKPAAALDAPCKL